jgi:hypothetical protein
MAQISGLQRNETFMCDPETSDLDRRNVASLNFGTIALLG